MLEYPAKAVCRWLIENTDERDDLLVLNPSFAHVTTAEGTALQRE